MPSERRKDNRVNLAIPVRIQGYFGNGGTWEELSTTTDVSTRGTCFPLSHPVELGQVLLLTLALPKRLRRHDENDSAYRVFSLVRVVTRESDRSRVGVMFFGKYPPRGFYDHPAGRYLLPGDPPPRAARAAGDVMPTPPTVPLAAAVRPDGPAAIRQDVPAAPRPGAAQPEFRPSENPDPERRGAPRTDVFVNFTVQMTDTQGNVLQQELTVADNISRTGARIMTALSIQVGDVVLLQEAGGAFATRAEIRAVTRGPQACERLHLRFVDREAPDRLLR